METVTLDARQQLQQRLDDPQIAAALARLLDHAVDFERVAGRGTALADSLPDLAATVTDVLDDQCRRAGQSGVDLQQRMQGLADLLLQLTSPATLDAIGELLQRLPQLAQLARSLDHMPQLVATAVDVLDDYARRLQADGIDVEKSLTQGLHAALWLGSRISETELDRLGILLRSDVLDTRALEVIGQAATALVHCQSESCQSKTPPRVGLLGLMGALRDPEFQQTLGFATRFAQCFGARIGKTAEPSNPNDGCSTGESRSGEPQHDQG